MWNYCNLYGNNNIATKCIYDEENEIDMLKKYKLKSEGKIKKYVSTDVENLIDENDRENNDQERIWCVFVKHQNNYIPVYHWYEESLLHVEISYDNVTNKSLKWNKKINYVYRIIVRDEEEMEYTKQPAIIITLLIFDDQTYQIIENMSLDVEFNPEYINSRSKPNNFCYKLFELSYDTYNNNKNKRFNVIGFGDNRMLCVCTNGNLNDNIEINIEKLHPESDLYETNLEYDYDDFNEFFYQ